MSALAQEQQNPRHGLRNSSSDVFLDVPSYLLDSCVVRFLMLPKLALQVLNFALCVWLQSNIRLKLIKETTI